MTRVSVDISTWRFCPCSKLRSLKNELVEIAIEKAHMELSVVALCHIYFETLVAKVTSR
jgi:hypothetical protein